MNTGVRLVSPLAAPLKRFVRFKRSMGVLYHDAEGQMRDLDRLLVDRLSPRAPSITLTIIRDFVACRGTESESTRSHRLTFIRDDETVEVPHFRETGFPSPSPFLPEGFRLLPLVR